VLRVLALLAVVGGVQDKKVKTLVPLCGGVQELPLSSGKQGVWSVGSAQPAEQPSGVAAILENASSGSGNGTTAARQEKGHDKEQGVAGVGSLDGNLAQERLEQRQGSRENHHQAPGVWGLAPSSVLAGPVSPRAFLFTLSIADA